MTKPLTPEQREIESQNFYEMKLKAIIEAQVEGGCKNFKCELVKIGPKSIEKVFRQGKNIGEDDTILVVDGLGTFTSVLRILLDTEGSKAAYGEDEWEDLTLADPKIGTLRGRSKVHTGYQTITKDILDAWHSEEGNNWQKAIDVGYDLLNRA